MDEEPERDGSRANSARESDGSSRANDRTGDEQKDNRATSQAVVDPGAAEVIRAMKTALGLSESPEFTTSIALRSFRNQSRTAPEEIDELRDRVLALLAAGGESEGLRVTPAQDEQTEYTLAATIYLIQRDGFDQWEIYFALRPVDANWTIWRNDNPIRMFRQLKSGGDAMQVMPVH